MPAEELTLCCYGVEVRLVDEAGLGLAPRLRETLPPEFAAPTEPAEALVAYLVRAETLPGTTQTEYVVSCDGVEVFATSSEDEVDRWLRRDIDEAVARRAPRLLFVHAGVVGWRGVAIVVPGRDPVGKSTLVAELVRRGAAYYSDAFAPLDEAGRVHPYRGLPEPDEAEGGLRDLRLLREDAPAEPLPVGLVVAGAHRPGSTWRPTVVRGAHSALPLVEATVLAREEATGAREVAARVAAGAVALRGPRPEAADVATQLLDLVDDALVSRAVGAAGGGAGSLLDDLARTAQLRLRSRTVRPASPARSLITTRHLRLTDFLAPNDRDRVLDCALAWEADFKESGVFGAEGKGTVDFEARKSRTLATGRLEELWDLFDGPLRAILPAVREELGIAWFPLGKIERQLTAHGRGGFFVPHTDTGHPDVAARRISCVYYFHRLPKPFTGGELKLCDNWVTPQGSTGAGTSTALAPIDNSVVFFPSEAFHEVRPVFPETDDFADSRFTITIWFWEGEQPTLTNDDEDEDPT